MDKLVILTDATKSVDKSLFGGLSANNHLHTVSSKVEVSDDSAELLNSQEKGDQYKKMLVSKSMKVLPK